MTMTLIERAFALARSGEQASVPLIKEQLRREGFARGVVEQSLDGKGTRAQLATLIAAARSGASG